MVFLHFDDSTEAVHDKLEYGCSRCWRMYVMIKPRVVAEAGAGFDEANRVDPKLYGDVIQFL